ncbi:GlxA family transcriptional regulator [Aliamphritea spongicola]|uniref:GlxA family transcriptional regulator n=1 Tax=Aliamphritea spongicola TaxID=707589 RepID=UPI00196B09D3|nr:GlxA family transcriptional regulator [Aliamphritea spongicola]MBN3562392.1 GlxA family transcriptional regulator [Aliamphritea spongicola]
MLRALSQGSCYRVGLVLLPGFSIMSLASVITPLNSANRISGRQLYHWTTLSLADEKVISADGMPYPVDTPLATAADFDAVIICAGENPQLSCMELLRPWLLARLKQRRSYPLELGALDAGSYVLAQMRLLDGYSCTVHWDYLTVMRESFPQVEVTNKLFVFDRNRFTCAGATATLDMMLYLICYHQGGELCAAISEQLNCERIRDEQESQRAPLQNYLGVGQPQLIEAMALMEANLEEPISTAELALLVGVSRRHLERQFQKYLQTTPTRFYLQLRLQRAQQLLRQTNMALLEIGLACGFANKNYFCKCYRDFFGTPPGEERRNVQGAAARRSATTPVLQ